MSKSFKGIINVDIRDSVPDWESYEAPKPPGGAPNVLMIVWDDTGTGVSDDYEAPFSFTGGTINSITINVSGEPYTDLEKEAQSMFSRQ